jgi:hypothetical protein
VSVHIGSRPATVMVFLLAAGLAGCSSGAETHATGVGLPGTTSETSANQLSVVGSSGPAATRTGRPVATGAMSSGARSPVDSAPSTATSSSVEEATSAAACRAGSLRVTLGATDSLMAQPDVSIVFTNISPLSCSLRGYPGVAALDGSGRQVTQAIRSLSIFEGGLQDGPPPLVVLAVNGQASALVGGSSNPGGGRPSCMPPYAGLLVTPPNTAESTKLEIVFPSCSGLLVTPVVAGAAGGEFN